MQIGEIYILKVTFTFFRSIECPKELLGVGGNICKGLIRIRLVSVQLIFLWKDRCEGGGRIG